MLPRSGAIRAALPGCGNDRADSLRLPSMPGVHGVVMIHDVVMIDSLTMIDSIII